MGSPIHFVSAGAGSGKTRRLTELLYEKLEGGHVRPDGVVATTFTRKAAAALRERVRSALFEKGEHGLAVAMGQARIGTVNSVCGELLERFAFEIGQPVGQRVLEEDQAAALVREAIDAVTSGDVHSDLMRVAGRLGIEDWQGELKAVLDAARSNDIEPGALEASANANANALLAHFPAPSADDLDGCLLGEMRGSLRELQEGAASGRKNTADYLALVQEMERRLAAGTAPWSAWVKLSKAAPEAALKHVATRIGSVASRYGEQARLHEDIATYVGGVFSLAARTMGEYAARKRALGVVDFIDQEHLLLQALDLPAVAEALRDELGLLLVDEFQDTSPIQLALFLRLAALSRETYWVGDVKQAIYGFRGSDAALMLSVLDSLPGLGGGKEVLGSSWRSRPALVALANAVFAEAFRGEIDPKDVVLEPRRRETLETPAFANWMLGGKNREEYSRALAAGIRAFVEEGCVVADRGTGKPRPVRYADVAILARTNDSVEVVAKALREAGVPWATAQPGLLSTPEAVLALACLRRLVDASDTVATAEILSLADCLQPEVWLAERLAYLDGGGDAERWREEGEGAHPVLAAVAGMRPRLMVLSPREALETVVAKCNLVPRILAWRPNELVARVRLANVEALLQLAAAYEDVCRGSGEAATVPGLILWLRQQAADGVDALAESAVDAVRVMTHHAAKGLEWPVVVLTDLSADIKDRLWGVSAESRGRVNATAPLADRFVRFWPWPFGDQRRVGVADGIAASGTGDAFRKEAVREAKRLLYVSMTRARDFLVMARPQKNPTGEWLDCLGAPWLLPDSPAQGGFLRLPGGEAIPYEARTLDPPAAPLPAVVADRALHWFESIEARTPRPPLLVHPSAAPRRACVPGETVRVAERIAVASGTDASLLGDAIHACMATAFADPGVDLTEADVSRILEGIGVGGAVPGAALRAQVHAFTEWTKSRWPGAHALPEVPIESALPNGQCVVGRMDLALKHEGAWVLIDHKSARAGTAGLEEVVGAFGGQMATYAEAIERATSEAVREVWLLLVMSGVAVRVSFGEAQAA